MLKGIICAKKTNQIVKIDMDCMQVVRGCIELIHILRLVRKV